MSSNNYGPHNSYDEESQACTQGTSFSLYHHQQQPLIDVSGSRTHHLHRPSDENLPVSPMKREYAPQYRRPYAPSYKRLTDSPAGQDPSLQNNIMQRPYMSYHQDHHDTDIGLKRKVESLERENLVLSTKLETMSNAFRAVMDTLPELLLVANPLGHAVSMISSSQSRPASVKLAKPVRIHIADEASNPLVRFWKKANWKTYMKERQSTSNMKLIANNYLEDKNGWPVSNERADAMRSHAQGLWITIFKAQVTPPTWGTANAEANVKKEDDEDDVILVMKLKKRGNAGEPPKKRAKVDRTISAPTLLQVIDKGHPSTTPSPLQITNEDHISATPSMLPTTNEGQPSATPSTLQIITDNPSTKSSALHTTNEGRSSTIPSALQTSVEVKPADNLVAQNGIDAAPVVTTSTDVPQLAANTTRPFTASLLFYDTLMCIDNLAFDLQIKRVLSSARPPNIPGSESGRGQSPSTAPLTLQTSLGGQSTHDQRSPRLPAAAVSTVPKDPPTGHDLQEVKRSSGKVMVPSGSLKTPWLVPYKVDLVTCDRVSQNPRNFAAIEWCRDNPGGLAAAFSAYWDALKATTEAEPFNKLSRDHAKKKVVPQKNTTGSRNTRSQAS
ncbi:hypothetical protein B0H34DRAFT_677848 [Crassisporium funariophilum]|nr:hypothetical protein B0H34DRAFT_677848 [Crassisporium funariophilum]